MNLPLKKSTHVGRGRILVCLFILLVAATSLAACMPLEQPSLSQPISPPQQVLDSPLVNNRWRVESVVYQGQDVLFSDAAPIYVTFTDGGRLTIGSYKDIGDGGHCGFVSYAIEYLAGQEYRLGQGMTPAVACPEPQGTQFENVHMALHATHRYELHESALVLYGESAEIRLVVE